MKLIPQKEIVEYYKRFPPEKGYFLSQVRLAFESIALWQFIKSLKSVRLGSEKWLELQEYFSKSSLVGLESIKRNAFYRYTLSVCGDNLYLHPGVIFYYPENIELGHDVYVNRGVFITARDKVKIGNNVLIGPYSVMNSGNHIYSNPQQLIKKQGHQKSPIVIENDIWIGAHVVVLAGVTIGEGAVVAASTVVTKSVQPYTVVAGIPSRIIKYRK